MAFDFLTKLTFRNEVTPGIPSSEKTTDYKVYYKRFIELLKTFSYKNYYEYIVE